MSVWLFLGALSVVAVWTVLNSFFLALVCIPLLATWGLVARQWLWPRGALGRSIAFVPLVTLGYLLYTDQNPTDSFYRDSFSSVTGHPFPSGGTLLYKDFSSGGNGDTFLCALFEVPESTYELLRQSICPGTSIWPPKGCADEALKQRGGSTIAEETSYDEAPDANYYWGLVDGRNEVVVAYSLR